MESSDPKVERRKFVHVTVWYTCSDLATLYSKVLRWPSTSC